MRILCNGAGFANKGSEAMLRTTQVELAKRLPSVEYFGWRITDWSARSAYNSALIPLALPFESGISIWSLLRGRVGILPWCLVELLKNRKPRDIASVFSYEELFSRACSHYLDRMLNDIDAVVNVSGFAFGDAMGVRGFRSTYPLIDYCKNSDTPMFFLPQAWGSFDKPEIKKAIRRLLCDTETRFFSRDETSCRHLEAALDKQPGSLTSYPDIAFCFQGGTEEQGKQLLRAMGCSMRRRIIGFSPNMRVYERVAGRGTGNQYIQALVMLVKHCIETYDVDVVLQANQIQKYNSIVDDRYLCSLIMDSVNETNRCFMTKDFLTAEESKALIGRFEFLVSSRFHSLVFGFSQGIPAMAVSWSHKYRELFSLFDMEADVHNCTAFNGAEMISTFDRCWSERQDRRLLILSKVKTLQARVDTLFDDVASIIQENSTTTHNATGKY